MHPSDPLAEAVDHHIRRHFGTVAGVWREPTPGPVQIEVRVVEPTPERPCFTLVTSGMSGQPMTVPEGLGVSPYAELMMALPEDWPLSEGGLGEWPFLLLKMVARLPHEFGAWLGPWHSVPNGDPAEPYGPDNPFAGVVVAPLSDDLADARTIIVDDGTEITLLALIPVHPAEIELKITQGADALSEALAKVDASELFDLNRPSGA